MLEITACCSGKEGVAPGYLNELACSVEGANEVDVATGGAIVDGKYYKNDDVVTLDSDDLPSPSAGNSRIDRIVLRATWANFETVITVITGTPGGSPSAPAITQTSGTTYDIPLYQALITDAGVVTLTDERTWAITPTDDSTLEDNGAGALRVKDSGITAAKIANRTRTFLVPCVEAYNSTDAAPIVRTSRVGYPTDNADLVHTFGNFIVPQDFASGMTVAPVWYASGGSGDIYYKSEAKYGASTQAYDTHETLGSYAAATAALNVWTVGTALSLTDAAVNDYVSMQFFRDATNGSDTYSGLHNIMGFLVSYTADS